MGLGVGAGVGVGLGVGAVVGDGFVVDFETTTPEFHTNFFPDFIQVNDLLL